ncbi:MAG: LysR family transcriptional regulator [Clostridia bacterium]|nr:LysR family transcriptional regulator [Clostridia bacterium]
MTLQQLRYFCVTAEVLHYTRAAELLYISQPSLSYALSKLEKELNMPLFEKRGKQIALTTYGAEFLPYAKRALSELSKGQERLKELRAPSAGIINLGYIYSVSFSVLPTFVDRFYAHYGSRQTAFRFHQGMAGVLIEQLLNGSLDLLIAGKPDIDSIDYLPIVSQELFLAVPASHRLASREAVTLSEIRDEQFISITHDAIIYRQLADRFKQADFVPNIVFEADEYSSIAASVTIGAGVAIVPKLPVLDNFNLRLIPFADTDMKRDVCMLRYRMHTLSPAAESVWSFARQVSEEFSSRR